MYSYDVFAATPCCDVRLHCKQCHQPVFELHSAGGHGGISGGHGAPLKYYSDYSRRVKCQHCSVEDYHFVKALDEVYDTTVKQRRQSAALPRI